MEEHTSKVIITRYFADVWNHRQLNQIEQLVSPQVILHERNTADIRGHAELRQLAATFFIRYSDAQFIILDMITEDHRLAVHLRLQATHQETGRFVTVTGMEFFHLANGQIAETWSNWDEFGLFQQIGGRIVFDSSVE